MLFDWEKTCDNPNHNELTSVISKLSTHHSSIPAIPVIITHWSPKSIETYLYSTIILCFTIHQSNISLIACLMIWRDYTKNISLCDLGCTNCLYITVHLLLHITPASCSPNQQLWMPIPLWSHSLKFPSFPSQLTSSRWYNIDGFGELGCACTGIDADRECSQ